MLRTLSAVAAGRWPRAARHLHTVCAIVLGLSVLSGAARSSAQTLPDLISISELDSTIVLDIRYASNDNFVGARIDGYEDPVCLLSAPAASALVEANRILAGVGFRLGVFDCYRPQRGVDHFVRWSRYALDQKMKSSYYPNVDKKLLFELGYIASRSGHSRASTADVGMLASADSSDDGPFEWVDMGTPFDYFDPLSHTDVPGLSPQQRYHRDVLRDAMRKAGFRNYAKEWWHYTLIDEPYRDQYFDVVVKSPRD